MVPTPASFFIFVLFKHKDILRGRSQQKKQKKKKQLYASAGFALVTKKNIFVHKIFKHWHVFADKDQHKYCQGKWSSLENISQSNFILMEMLSVCTELEILLWQR